MTKEQKIHKIREYVWVVTHCDLVNLKPIITVFDNEVVAKDCYNYYIDHHLGCGLYKCPIYSTFKVAGIVAEGDTDPQESEEYYESSN